MSATQIVAVLSATGVACMYLAPLVSRLFSGKGDPELLTHMRHVIAVRDSYRTPEITDACNALMEAMLGIK